MSAYAFSLDSTRLAALTRERVIGWDLLTGEVVFAISRGEGRQIFYSPDKTEVYTVDANGLVRVIDGETGQQLTTFQAQQDYAGYADFLPLEGLLALVGESGQISVWDPLARDLQVRFTADDARITDITFAPDGATLAVSTAGGTIEIWDWAARERVTTLTDPDAEPVGQVVIAPGGNQAAAGTETDVRLWDISEGQITHILLTGQGGAEDVLAYAPDGALLVNSGLTEAMNLWNPASGELAAALPELGGNRTAAAFNSSGDLMLGSVFEGGVYLYNLTTVGEAGLQRADLPIDVPVIDVGWSPDGRTLALFDTRGSVHIFGIPAPPPTPTPDITPVPTLDVSAPGS